MQVGANLSALGGAASAKYREDPLEVRPLGTPRWFPLPAHLPTGLFGRPKKSRERTLDQPSVGEGPAHPLAPISCLTGGLWPYAV